MSVDYFFWLNQIQPCHRDRVGSKAFYLALLQQRGYPVIPGLVASSNLFQAFLNQIEWADPTFADLPGSSLYIDVDHPRQLQRAAQQIRQAIISTTIPESWLLPLKLAIGEWQAAQQTETVILRPSFSLASGLDSSLSYHTRGLLDAKICRAAPESIAQTLKQVWAELFRARSLLYWQRLGIQPQQIQLAVLMQPIQSTIAAGQVIDRGNELEVQALWGLGHGIAQGVSPDRYRVDAAGTLYRDTISRKNVAYGITASEVAASEQAEQSEILPGGIEQADCLQIIMLQPEQQTQPVLTQSQIDRLSHLSRQVSRSLDLTVELEWMLCAVGADSARAEAQEPELSFYITQVIPQSTRLPKSCSVPAVGTTPIEPATPEAESHTVLKGTASKGTAPKGTALKGTAAAPGKVTATVWVMLPTSPRSADLAEIPPGCVLVASLILPEWIPHLSHIAGIVTEQGGTTSHGAILARELGIPAVVGVAEAMQILQTGETVLLNGDRGEVIPMLESPDPFDRAGFDRRDASLQIMPATATRLLVSISQTESIAKTSAMAIDGIGLLRSEWLWLKILEDRSPEEWLRQDRAGLVDRLAQQIQPFAEAMMPRPVFYRSLDGRAHEFPALATLPTEQNPTLGLRGTHRYRLDPAWFEVELAALHQLQQAGYHNLRLVLPFVRTVEEFIFCRDRVEQAGLRQSPFELWIMAEVPSVLLLLSDYIAAGVQGMAIGCNDLTQLLLGVDRDHPQMAAQFNMTHPVVMQAIQQIVETCRTAGLPCTVCGHLPRQLDVIDRLVEWGVTGISVEPGDGIWMGQAIERAERKLILERARRLQA